MGTSTHDTATSPPPSERTEDTHLLYAKTADLLMSRVSEQVKSSQEAVHAMIGVLLTTGLY